MLFKDVYRVSDKLDLVAEDDLLLLQERLGMPLPDGYAGYMTELGIGTFCGLLNVYEPDRTLRETDLAHQWWQNDFFWEAGHDVLTRGQAMKSIVFASTDFGDNVLFCPQKPGTLYVLPRHDDNIYWMPDNFNDSLLWYSRNGVEHTTPAFTYFETWRDAHYLELFTSIFTFKVPELAEYCAKWWADSEIHFVEAYEKDEDGLGDLVVTLFLKAIGGSITLDQESLGNSRASIRIDYDVDSTHEVVKFANELLKLGFYQTSSSIQLPLDAVALDDGT